MKKAIKVLPRGYGHASLWKSRLKAEQCYHNALKVAELLDCEYIEGYIWNGKEDVQHAWNRHNGEEFDLTYQLFCPKLLQCTRKPIVIGTLKDLSKQGYLLDPVYATLCEQKDRLGIS
jgi:hypothetical protein